MGGGGGAKAARQERGRRAEGDAYDKVWVIGGCSLSPGLGSDPDYGWEGHLGITVCVASSSRRRRQASIEHRAAVAPCCPLRQVPSTVRSDRSFDCASPKSTNRRHVHVRSLIR